MQVNYSPRGTGDADTDRMFADIAAAFKKIERGAGIPLGYAPLGADGLIDPSFIGDLVTPSTLHVSATGAANSALTATLPAVSGKRHAITSIRLVRIASAAVAGAGGLFTSSTNLPGNPFWGAGNLIAAGQAITDLAYDPANPLQAVAAGVATTITMPAAGANVVNQINVSYLLVSA